MKLRLVELQVENSQARKIRAKKLGRNWQDSNEILYYYGLPYISEIIKTKLISTHYNDLLASHFDIKKIPELVAKNNY